jgi:guanylate kinase
MAKGLFLVVSGPSGTGKSSICRRLLKSCPEIKFSVSYTSRPPRPKEINGKDYYFISRKDFQARIKKGEFAEWVENYGHLYGTSWKIMEEFRQKGDDLLLDIELRGAKKIKQKFKGGVFVFVLSPSFAELLKRLKKRGHEDDETIRARLAQAGSDLKGISWYDYVIFNDALEKAADQLRSIYIAQKCRKSSLLDRIKQFVKNNNRIRR